MVENKRVVPSDNSFIFNTLKARYTVLDELPILDKLSNTLTFIIDSRELFKALYSDFYIDTTVSILNQKQSYMVAAEVMNIIAHYRRYFDACNIDTRFFILHSNNDHELSSYHPQFWKEAHEFKPASSLSKFLDFVVEKRLKTIAQYAREVYVISSEGMEKPVDSATLGMILQADGIFDEEEDNIIVSSDNSFLRLIEYIPNAYQMRFHNTNPSVTPANKIFTNWIQRKLKTKATNLKPEHFKHFVAIEGMLGLPHLVDALKLGGVLKRLDALAEKTKGDLTPELLTNLFIDKVEVLDIHRAGKAGVKVLEDGLKESLLEVIEKRLDLITLNNRVMDSRLDKVDKLKVLSQYVTAEDPETLSKLNIQYFNNSVNVKMLE